MSVLIMCHPWKENTSMLKWKEIHPMTLSRIRLTRRLLIICLMFSFLIAFVLTPAQTEAQNTGNNSFFDRLGSSDPLFYSSDGYGNGSPFINAWKSDHVT